MWDYEMSENEVKALTCAAQGNIASMATLEVQGSNSLAGETFECNGKLHITFPF